ncbi:GNAT family N-acetyltransferase [Tumebacillus sp. ITR2]|uniref:GNAT family N-acetyltransferase n=1 Tax=Tumebacillus amylolyticus TaxID=2801339 RepID=A0ABS1J6G4_9BACL|nr:GNAT family N-acetyltransferase [Tumebacillus amylolyticus]MBL0385863.1 GNAT family N-acetyltransferase [Tumebacillus amylolyticus]
MLQLVRLDEGHIEDLVALSTKLGWDYAPPELRLLLTVGIAYGHVNEEGRVVSSAAVFPYEGLASIGGVMVDPSQRRQGLGTKVMERVLEEVPDIPTMLCATAQGKFLYEAMGFHTVGTLHKYLAERYVPVKETLETAEGPKLELFRAGNAHELEALRFDDGFDLAPIRSADFERILELDALSIGARRRKFLQMRIAQASDGMVLRKAGEIVGFALAVQGPIYRVIGPVVAPDAQLALMLVEHLARRHDGALRIDIPTEQTELVEAMPLRGFHLANVPPIMLIGGEQLPPRHSSLFAISSQAYG